MKIVHKIHPRKNILQKKNSLRKQFEKKSAKKIVHKKILEINSVQKKFAKKNSRKKVHKKNQRKKKCEKKIREKKCTRNSSA